jgi:hypothetical protein
MLLFSSMRPMPVTFISIRIMTFPIYVTLAFQRLATSRNVHKEPRARFFNHHWALGFGSANEMEEGFPGRTGIHVYTFVIHVHLMTSIHSLHNGIDPSRGSEWWHCRWLLGVTLCDSLGSTRRIGEYPSLDNSDPPVQIDPPE